MEKMFCQIDKLQTILEASKVLNSSKDTNEILSFLLKKSLELIKGGDTGVIFIYNKATGLLDMRSYIGFDDCIADVKLKPDESMTGLSFTTQKTIFFNNPDKIRKAMSNMSAPNVQMLETSIKDTIGKAIIYGTICCPLMYQDECIGVIVIDSMKNYAALTDDDVTVLEAISVQATIAIINAQNYETEMKDKEMLMEYSKLLKVERNRYLYSSYLHSKFTDMVLNGSDISDILIEISSLLERDVFVVDLFYNIGYAALGRYTNYEKVSEVFEEMASSLGEMKELEHYCSDIKLYFKFFPILVNKDLLGWICIVSDNRHYADLNKITIERGSTIIALELLKKNELSSMEQALKGDFLDNLILNQNNDYLIKCAKNYKFNMLKGHQLIIVEIQKSPDESIPEPDNMELKGYVKYTYDLLSKASGRIFHNSIEIIKGNNIIIIVEESEDNRKNIKKLLGSVDTDSRFGINMFKRVRIISGISDVIPNIDDFKSAYVNAQWIIRMLEGKVERNFYLFYDDLEIKKLLLNNKRSDLEQFSKKFLGKLLEPDNDSKEYMRTLKLYIQSNGNWTYTKDQLHIHGNTLSYRLNRIMSILNLDLNDYNDRLKVQIALEIQDLLLLSRHSIGK